MPRSDAVSRELTPAGAALAGRMPWWARRAAQLLFGAVLLAAALYGVWGVPTARGTEIDVVVIGDGAVVSARDEVQRRLRQEGWVPLIVEVDSSDCATAPLHFSAGDVVVLSFADWSACDSRWSVDRRVQQPEGGLPVSDRVRRAEPLFNGADRETCQWWDTPGAGEDRPGLGRCAPDGMVTVLADGVLTPAGRERFARLLVGSIGAAG